MNNCWGLLLISMCSIHLNAQDEWDTTAHQYHSISPDLFETHKSRNASSPYQLNDSLKFPVFHWRLLHACDETCEASLTDYQYKDTLNLPSSFDQGIIGIEVSPDAKKFLIFSSYDTPDYHLISSIRAEIYVFSIPTNFQIKDIQMEAWMVETEFSIFDATWISNRKIALKCYSGELQNEEINNHFEYRAITY